MLQEDESSESFGTETHLKNKCFIKNRREVLSLNFGLKFLFLVREHVDFDVGVRSATDVHRRKILSLKHSDYELKKKTIKQEANLFLILFTGLM